MFNLALLLQRNNKHAEAAEYWRRYLANDTQSEWGSTGASVLKILRNANAPIGVVTSRQTQRKSIGADKGAKPDPTTSGPRNKSYVATGATAYAVEDACDAIKS